MSELTRKERDALLELGEKMADAARKLLPWVESVAAELGEAVEQWDALMAQEYRA